MELMHQLADEIRETFAERGWAIEKAIGIDKAFSRTRRAQSAMTRELVIDAIETASSQIGVTCLTAAGGAYDVADASSGVDRRYRVHKASLNPETEDFVILWTSDSIFVVTDVEPESFFRVERWVLGYTVDADGLIGDIFAAEVIGKTDSSIPSLILGPVTLLGTGDSSTTPPGNGFRPADEADLFGDGDGDAGVAGAM